MLESWGKGEQSKAKRKRRGEGPFAVDGFRAESWRGVWVLVWVWVRIDR